MTPDHVAPPPAGVRRTRPHRPAAARVVLVGLMAAALLGATPALAERGDDGERRAGFRAHHRAVADHLAAHHRAHHDGRVGPKHLRLHRADPRAHHLAHHRAEERRDNAPVPTTPGPTTSGPTTPGPTPPGPQPTPEPPVRALPAGWVTTPDERRRVDPLRAAELVPGAAAVRVEVDATSTYQSMDGFGAALTESSAHLLAGLPASRRAQVLRELFDPVDGAGIDLVRLPLGASDFALSHYSYLDLPAGQSDPTLSRFSLARDDVAVVPVLREAVAVNPRLQVMATAWSAPGWMKTSGSLVGGTLRADHTGVYARYLARAVGELRDRGVPVRLLTLGNEPKHSPHDYPGMLMDPRQQAALAVALSTQLALAGVTDVQLIGYDHNWDDTGYPTALLADPDAHRVLAGTAFHCYAGSPSAQSTVHAAAPDKAIWFTECSGGGWATRFGGNLGWNAHTLLIGATRNWARSVLLWNLALDPTGGPHTGGCTNCRGVLTVDPATGAVTRNVEYDVLALAGKAVRPGAIRIGSPASVQGVATVAYRNPDGTHALIAYNSWQTDREIVVDDGHTRVGAPLPAGAVATLAW